MDYSNTYRIVLHFHPLHICAKKLQINRPSALKSTGMNDTKAIHFFKNFKPVPVFVLLGFVSPGSVSVTIHNDTGNFWGLQAIIMHH